jgi:hypothetical protein
MKILFGTNVLLDVLLAREAARAAGVAAIVTRNTKDFSGATVPVFAPEELLSAALAEEP